jgi:Xaa-Pro aminopeptidase
MSTVALVLLLAAWPQPVAAARTGSSDTSSEAQAIAPAAGQEHVRRCGLGAAFHGGRRALLAATLKAETPNGLVLVRGLPAPRDYERFQQDKTFWYLTGVESPNAALVLDLATGDEILFLPRPNAMTERWSGEQWDCEDAWVRTVTGFRDVRPHSELVGLLKERTANAQVVWISQEPWITLAGCHDMAGPYDSTIANDPLDGRVSREKALQARLEEKFGVEARDCSKFLAEMRRVKTGEELAALRRASEIGARSMEEAIRSTRAGLTERHLEAVMSFVHRADGAEGPGYHGIVGCGPNALILHYSQVGRELRAGEMVLIDYAPEFDHYVSDITRSWPVDGKFTPRMAEIYDAVLAAQAAGIAETRPGKTMVDVEKACRRVLSERGMLKLLPHGTCHYVGMEVHDVGQNGKPFVPGVVFTIEPGVYEQSTGIGVRIEDVVVVTETGCEVISAGVPKDRSEITRLIAEEGILDTWPGDAPRPPEAVTKTTPVR